METYELPQGALVHAGFSIDETHDPKLRSMISRGSSGSLGPPRPLNYALSQIFNQEDQLHLRDDGRVLNSEQRRLYEELKLKGVMWTRLRQLPELIICSHCKHILEVRTCRRADEKNMSLTKDSRLISELSTSSLKRGGIYVPPSTFSIDLIPRDELLPFEPPLHAEDELRMRDTITIAQHENAIDKIRDEIARQARGAHEELARTSQAVQDLQEDNDGLKAEVRFLETTQAAAITEKKIAEERTEAMRTELGKAKEDLLEERRQKDAEIQMAQIGMTRAVDRLFKCKQLMVLRGCFDGFVNERETGKLVKAQQRKDIDWGERLRLLKNEVESKDRQLKDLQLAVDKVNEQRVAQATKHIKRALLGAHFCFRFWKRTVQLLALENRSGEVYRERDDAVRKAESAEVTLSNALRIATDVKHSQVVGNALRAHLRDKVKVLVAKVALIESGMSSKVLQLGLDKFAALREGIGMAVNAWKGKLIRSLVVRFCEKLRLKRQLRKLRMMFDTREVKVGSNFIPHSLMQRPWKV